MHDKPTPTRPPILRPCSPHLHPPRRAHDHDRVTTTNRAKSNLSSLINVARRGTVMLIGLLFFRPVGTPHPVDAIANQIPIAQRSATICSVVRRRKYILVFWNKFLHCFWLDILLTVIYRICTGFKILYFRAYLPILPRDSFNFCSRTIVWPLRHGNAL